MFFDDPAEMAKENTEAMHYALTPFRRLDHTVKGVLLFLLVLVLLLIGCIHTAYRLGVVGFIDSFLWPFGLGVDSLSHQQEGLRQSWDSDQEVVIDFTHVPKDVVEGNRESESDSTGGQIFNTPFPDHSNHGYDQPDKSCEYLHSSFCFYTAIGPWATRHNFVFMRKSAVMQRSLFEAEVEAAMLYKTIAYYKLHVGDTYGYEAFESKKTPDLLGDQYHCVVPNPHEFPAVAQKTEFSGEYEDEYADEHKGDTKGPQLRWRAALKEVTLPGAPTITVHWGQIPEYGVLGVKGMVLDTPDKADSDGIYTIASDDLFARTPRLSPAELDAAKAMSVLSTDEFWVRAFRHNGIRNDLYARQVAWKVRDAISRYFEKIDSTPSEIAYKYADRDGDFIPEGADSPYGKGTPVYPRLGGVPFKFVVWPDWMSHDKPYGSEPYTD